MNDDPEQALVAYRLRQADEAVDEIEAMIGMRHYRTVLNRA